MPELFFFNVSYLHIISDVLLLLIHVHVPTLWDAMVWSMKQRDTYFKIYTAVSMMLLTMYIALAVPFPSTDLYCSTASSEQR